MKYGLALVLITLGMGASVLLFQLASHPSVPEGAPAANPASVVKEGASVLA